MELTKNTLYQNDIYEALKNIENGKDVFEIFYTMQTESLKHMKNVIEFILKYRTKI